MTDTSEPEDTSATEPGSEPGSGQSLAWIAIAVGVVALAAGGYAIVSQVQPQLLGRMGPASYDPAPQEAALGALAARVEKTESHLTEAIQSLKDLTTKQASLALMAEQMDTLIQEMDAVADRLDGARRRIDTIADGVRDADVVERVDTLANQIRQFETDLSGVDGEVQAAEARLASLLSALESRLGELTSRIRLLEVAQPERAAGAAAVALAVGQLRISVLDGQPFAAPLANVRTLLAAEGQPASAVSHALTTLDSHAGAGVETLSALRRKLAAEAATILRAGTLQTKGWMDETLRRLAAVVTVRRTGEVSGLGAEALLARAEARVEAGDLAAAVAELSELTGAAADAAVPWLGSARARLAVKAALADLEAYAVSRVATIHDATKADGAMQ